MKTKKAILEEITNLERLQIDSNYQCPCDRQEIKGIIHALRWVLK